MKRRVFALALFCFALLPLGTAHAQTISPVIDQTTPFRDPAVNGDVVYKTGDELGGFVSFTGARRLTNITFKYTSLVPVNYTVRFYKLPVPVTPQLPLGPALKTVTFTNLPAGTNIITRELTPDQQFDWTSALTPDGSIGGFFSVQLTRTDGSNPGVEAGHPLAVPRPFYPGYWINLTRFTTESPGTVGAIPFRPEFEEGLPSADFFIKISGFNIAAPALVRVSSLSLSTNSVVGGTSLTGTITMTAPVLEDTPLPIFSRSAVQAPATVTIPSGAQSVTFPITTSPVPQNGSYPIQVSYGGQTKQQFLVVTPSAATLTSLTLSVSSVRGGTGLRGVVMLSGPFDQDRTVTISNSSNGSVIQTPLTVTVPAGAQFASFPISTSEVTRNQSVTIRATFAGKTEVQTLTVTRRR